MSHLKNKRTFFSAIVVLALLGGSVWWWIGGRPLSVEPFEVQESVEVDTTLQPPTVIADLYDPASEFGSYWSARTLINNAIGGCKQPRDGVELDMETYRKKLTRFSREKEE